MTGSDRPASRLERWRDTPRVGEGLRERSRVDGLLVTVTGSQVLGPPPAMPHIANASQRALGEAQMIGVPVQGVQSAGRRVRVAN